ncbi:MAG: Tad domain-containing protein [Chloroflexota bacterium]
MPTPSCPSLRRSRRQPPDREPARQPRSEGQILVIFAVAFLVLLFFIGLAIDAGSLYVTYGHLKRAVDAGAVAAANTFKRGENLASMTAATEEVMVLHNVDTSMLDLRVFICDADGDSNRDSNLPAEFYARCPDTSAGQSPRKLVWVEATQRAPLYFLGLLGFGPVNLTTNAIAEAAAVDLVIVLDISESMASDTPGFVPDDYDPDSSCNPLTRTRPVNRSDPPPAGACLPMWHAKNAADALISRMYQGFDQVAIVTYDSRAELHPIPNLHGVTVALTDDLEAARNYLWNDLKVHDDPPVRRIWKQWVDYRAVNPVNPEDRDGDGSDSDNPTIVGYTCPNMADARMADRWWAVSEGGPDPYGWGGVPCDDDGLLDAYDWDGDGVFTMADHNAALAYLAKYPVQYSQGRAIRPSLSPLSTCIGCGLRAANLVLNDARPGAVWVVVLFTDGVANLSDTAGSGGSGPGDTPWTGGLVPLAYPNGFCDGRLNQGWWPSLCIDTTLTPRYCIDDQEQTCPPGSTWIRNNNQPSYHRNNKYSVNDYVRDMADALALTRSTNQNEPRGNDVAVYSIGLGAVSLGEPLLRYIAAVGDDGDRTTDPCATTPAYRSCGQYYYTNNPEDLVPIFEDIATRIYTRITQ